MFDRRDSFNCVDKAKMKFYVYTKIVLSITDFVIVYDLQNVNHFIRLVMDHWSSCISCRLSVS